MSLIKKTKNKNKKIFTRTAIIFFLILIAIIAPSWIAFLISILLILFLKMYETIFIGLILDMIYSGSTSNLPFGDFT